MISFTLNSALNAISIGVMVGTILAVLGSGGNKLQKYLVNNRFPIAVGLFALAFLFTLLYYSHIDFLGLIFNFFVNLLQVLAFIFVIVSLAILVRSARS